MTEKDLVRQVCERNDQAFETLYRIYHDKLYRFLSRMHGSHISSSFPGIINEVMYVVWNKAETFTAKSRVSTWIFGIAVNVSRKTFATEWRHIGNIDASVTEESVDDHLDATQSYEIVDWLEKGMQTLSTEHRAVVELAYFQGLHYREIAEILDCPENTVKTRMFHARTKLAKAMRLSSIPDLPERR